MSCYDGWDFSEDIGVMGECPECGEETIDGSAMHGCHYSPLECETCGSAPCDLSCQTVYSGVKRLRELDGEGVPPTGTVREYHWAADRRLLAIYEMTSLVDTYSSLTLMMGALYDAGYRKAEVKK